MLPLDARRPCIHRHQKDRFWRLGSATPDLTSMLFFRLILLSCTLLSTLPWPLRAQQLPPDMDVRPERLRQAQKDRAEFINRSPWMDRSKSPDQRARAVLEEMTPSEKTRLLNGNFATLHDPTRERSDEKVISAGYVSGLKRLGIPSLIETDGDVGVTNPGITVDKSRQATVLPSVLATAATWQPELARQSGLISAKEARHFGFNVLLAGNAGLLREPRAGRAYESPGEDPLLSARIAAAKINGIQSQHVLATIKHFAVNAQETGRQKLSATLDRQALAESDLLAFEYALESSQPGAAMCSYNRLNGEYACQNDYLLNQVLKQRWHFPGFVMSDWGAVYSTVQSANAGLDQESAAEDFDGVDYFGALLEKAVQTGAVSQARLDDMVLRILRSYFAVGLVDDHPRPLDDESIDFEAHAEVTRKIAENGIVLLRNEGGQLPLDSQTDGKIAVIGGHADRGVTAGGGSSTVNPIGGDAVPEDAPPKGVNAQRFYPPSSPLRAIRQLAPKAQVEYADGWDMERAVKLARSSQVALVFVSQWTSETFDMPTLSLKRNQDALIEAVAKANPNTVVILETGGPVAMPWRDRVKGILAAWYPGQRGGQAIADILFGVKNPAGRLPVTFPQNERQLPRPEIPGLKIGNSAFFDVDYNIEGADVGYRWFARQGIKPLYPFGYGLSYSTFTQGGLKLAPQGQGIRATFEVSNSGKREGRTVPQLYVNAPDGSPLRLGGWASLSLKPGQSRQVSIDIDPRQLARFDSARNQWHLAKGSYRVSLASSAQDLGQQQRIDMPESWLGTPGDGAPSP